MKSRSSQALVQPPPPEPKKRTLLYVLLGFSAFFIFSLVFLVLILQHLFEKSSGSTFLPDSEEISLIEIEGPIYQSDDIVRRIKRFTNSSKKVLLLRLDSPGGAVAPSQEIYDEVLHARENKKIVIASMSSLAASGAYYIAAACDRIVANPGTITASIGVIAEFPQGSALLQKVGLHFETIKSGKFKDTGSFSRPMDPLERGYLQETINEIYGQFLDSVLAGRASAFKDRLGKRLRKDPGQVTDQEVRAFVTPYADGRILTGQKAYDLGFVDKLGNYYDAVKVAADLAGIKGEPRVRSDKPTKFDKFMNSLSSLSFGARSLTGLSLEFRTF